MKAAIYARISTPRKLERQNPDTQLLPLRSYCKKRGWKVAAEFIDDVSAIKRRPHFEQMLKDAHSRRFDIIIAVRLDRCFRSLSDFVTVMQKLNHDGVRFLTTDQPIDTDKSDPSGQLLMQVIAAVAEFERSLISERVRSGIARVRANGKKWGGSKPKPIDMDQAQELRRQGWSLVKISRTLNCNRNTLAKRIGNIGGGSRLFNGIK